MSAGGRVGASDDVVAPLCLLVLIFLLFASFVSLSVMKTSIR